METIGSKIVTMLNNESFGASHVSLYMKHLIVQAEPSSSVDRLTDLQAAIGDLINARFPLRTEDLPFLVRRAGQQDTFFTIHRTARSASLTSH